MFYSCSYYFLLSTTPCSQALFLGACAHDNCRGWSSYSSSSVLSELLYSDSSSLLEALSEEIFGESPSEAEPVKRAAAASAEYSLDLQKY